MITTKKQEYEANKLKFFLDFDKYLDSFTSNGVKLKDLLKFVIEENKKYTVNDLDYTFIIRAEEEEYESTSTRCSFEDLMQLKEDTGLTVKFEVIRIQHEIDTVETNHGKAYDDYEFSDTVISSIDSEVIIDTYYY